MSSYRLKLAAYEGPLEKLLELIEAKKLEVNTISLAEVTDDFLRYLRSLTEVETSAAHMRMVADFIVVASRLIFIKSKSLLPELTLSEEEESDIKDLERRLALYRDLRPAMKHIEKMWRGNVREWSRPYFLHMAGIRQLAENGGGRFFYPGEATTIDALRAALGALFVGVERLVREESVVRETIVTLEEKMKDVVRRMITFATTSFRKLSGAGSRGEIIVAFLAILHLAREQAIVIEQESHLSDIIIKKMTN